MSVAAKTKVNTASVTRKHKFLGGNQRNQNAKNFNETVCLQSEKRKEWVREERLQEIAKGTCSAPRLTSSSAASFPRKDECPGTHCSLIEQEREGSCCLRVVREKESWRRGQNKSRKERKSGRLCVAETSKERAQ